MIFTIMRQLKDDMDSKRERNHAVAQEHQEIVNQGRLSLCMALVDLYFTISRVPGKGLGVVPTFFELSLCRS